MKGLRRWRGVAACRKKLEKGCAVHVGRALLAPKEAKEAAKTQAKKMAKQK